MNAGETRGADAAARSRSFINSRRAIGYVLGRRARCDTATSTSAASGFGGSPHGHGQDRRHELRQRRRAAAADSIKSSSNASTRRVDRQATVARLPTPPGRLGLPGAISPTKEIEADSTRRSPPPNCASRSPRRSSTTRNCRSRTPRRSTRSCARSTRTRSCTSGRSGRSPASTSRATGWPTTWRSGRSAASASSSGLADSSYINFGYWDSLKKGLLAGEKLQYDLRRLEALTWSRTGASSS